MIPVSPLVLIFGAFALLILNRIYYELSVGAARRKMIKEHGCLPANKLPHKDPIFGLDMIMENARNFKQGKFLEAGRERALKYGYTVQFNLLGMTAYSTSEPENVKTMLSLKFQDFMLGPRRRRIFNHILGSGIFSSDGAAWEHSRAMLRPNFVRSQVGDLDTFETHVGHLIDAIPRDGSTVDLQDLFFRLTIDSATEFLFGESTNCLAPGLDTHSTSSFAEAFTYLTEYMGRDGRTGGLSRWLPDAKYKGSKKVVHDFADRYVQQAIDYHRTHDVEKLADSKSNGRYVFLYELVKQTNDAIELRSELLNILLAGRDTTASLLSNAWFVMARRPDIWAKLRAEVDALGGERPTYQQVKDMKYLRYLLNESLRLHPVVPGNSRMSTRDTVLPLGGGPDGKSPLFIPEGTVVGYSTWNMHRRKDFFGEDADDFKPERWQTLRPGWEYLPFNGGPRICIGQQFALTEASYTTIRIMQNFSKIEPRDERPWQEWVTLTMACGVGTKVALTPA